MSRKANPKIGYQIPKEHSIIDYFWNKVDKTSGKGPWGDCWIWQGNKDSSGYGVVGVRCFIKRISSHKLSYSLHKNNRIIAYNPEGRILHKCDIPLCVNPEHLFLGTQPENIYDMVNKGRQYRPSGDKNPKAKLNESNVLKIFNSKESIEFLALHYRVSTSAIKRIKTRKTWRHILD